MMNYKRELIGDNVGFSTIIDEKFNTCYLSVKFIIGTTKENAAANEIVCDLIPMSNSRIRSMSEMNRAVSELYAATIGSSIHDASNVQVISLWASWICNRFALENEDITGSMLEIIHDCIFNQNAENGAFDSKNFRIVQKDVIDDIKGILNDKRDYAIMQAKKAAFRGEPIEHTFIEVEDVEKVTPESAYEAYRELIEKSQVEIFYVSSEENPSVIELFRKSFAETKRNSSSYTVYGKSGIKPEPEKIIEEMVVNQSKMILVLKSDCEDKDTMGMLACILGGTPVSKLFVNVRERLSLCYYCACYYLKKNILMIESGVDKENVQKAYDEIFNQIEEIKKGNITDEEIQAVLNAIGDSAASIGDTAGEYVRWYFESWCSGEVITPQEHFERMCRITKEQIVEAAKTLKPDTSYYLLNKEVSE